MSLSHLFEPGSIGSCNLRNRIIMALYPTKFATDSKVNARMLEFYRARAKGGVAMIVLDCPCLDYPRAYKGSQELRIDTEEYVSGVKELLSAIQGEGAKAFMQLNYPRERESAVEVPWAKKKGDTWIRNLANGMSLEEAVEIIGIMARGAGKARGIGYNGIEIQASYGDFVAQLLSPLSNKRPDEMGGSLENRAGFLLNLIKEVKKEAGSDFPVFVKLVCEEFVPGGLTIKDSWKVAKWAEAAGADAILANAGNKTTKAFTIPGHNRLPGALVDIAAQIKAAVGIPVIAIGKINNPELADEIISTGKADFIAMVRALVADPDLPAKAQAGELADIRPCVYCLEDCADKGVPGLGRACTVNPFAGLEYCRRIEPALERKKALVIGGGPAGMQAAVLAAQRGHSVELWEKEEELGGQLVLASKAPYKQEMEKALNYLRSSLERAGVLAILNKPGNRDSICLAAPDVLILATGSNPVYPRIPGINSEIVIDARKIYLAEKVGKRVLIIGGGDIGCETADYLAEKGAEVTVVEALPDILPRMKSIPKQELQLRLEHKAVKILTEAKVMELKTNKARIQLKNGTIEDIETDQVVVAVGSAPDNRLAADLEGSFKGKIILVGETASVGNLGSALRSATEAALNV